MLIAFLSGRLADGGSGYILYDQFIYHTWTNLLRPNMHFFINCLSYTSELKTVCIFVALFRHW